MYQLVWYGPHDNQPFDWTRDLCLEILTLHCNELRLLLTKEFPIL